MKNQSKNCCKKTELSIICLKNNQNAKNKCIFESAKCIVASY